MCQLRLGKPDFSRFACGQAVIILLSANAIYTWQIYGPTTIKSGRVIVWKAIMTVEAAGLNKAGVNVNLVCLT